MPVINIYLHKRDFRLFDNEVLYFLNNQQEPYLIVYIFEKSLENTYERSYFHKQAILESLSNLYKNYKTFGIKILITEEEIIDFLKEIQKKFFVKYLCSYEENGSLLTYQRDKKLKIFCKENNIAWKEFRQFAVFRGLKDRDIRKKLIDDFLSSQIFPIPKLKEFEFYRDITYLESKKYLSKILHFNRDYNLQKLSEKEAYKNFNDFLERRSKFYLGCISSPNTAFEYGSRLSAYLSYGLISYKYVMRLIDKKIKILEENKNNQNQYRGLINFRSRLFWHDHFIQRIEDFPELEIKSINDAYNNLNFKNFCSETEYSFRLNAFKEGKIGELLVDACVRCLNKNGFLNFRMRAMLVSYAVFVLHLDWRDVGYILASKFLDYEPGIHWSQIQMQAGITGINTIRVYDPLKQLKDHDKEASFVKKYITEIEDNNLDDILNYRKIKLKNYFLPIVDYKKMLK